MSARGAGKVRRVMGSLFRGGLAAVALSAVVPAGRLVAQSGDGWVGTWKLNPAESKFVQGPALKSNTLTIEKTEAGYKFTAKTVRADGTSAATEYVTNFDGKDVPVTGAADYDALWVKLMNSETRHTVRKKGGKE